MNPSRRAASQFTAIVMVVVVSLGILLCVNSCTIVPPGHVGVQVTFGSVGERGLTEGSYMINPFSHVSLFDCRQQTWKEEGVTVPSQDQLMTTVDVSIQYRIIATQAASILRDTGDAQRAIEVHLEPKLRSSLREVGKGLKQAEDFFLEATQVKLQTELYDELAAYCRPKGIEVQAVLLRNIQLPPVVVTAVNAKKQREQLAIQQQAELTRFTVEAQQKVATATAEQEAAVLTAKRTVIEADAEAYKIMAINKATASNPAYVQLKALEALQAISKDPAAKVYFLNGESPQPLPLMHMGDVALPPTK